MTRLAAAFLLLVATGASWIDPHATARQAARLYDAGKFGDAAAKYREALVDDPDSALLHYNAGVAAYRDGKYEDALAALAGLAAADADPARASRSAYNAGNAKYRLGAAAEAQNPQQALGLYAEALAAYRRAMGADPADTDAKVNHELVEKRIADLKKKLEEQQKQQEQQEQQDQQQKQDEQRQPDDQQQAGGPEKPADDAQQQAATPAPEKPGERPPGGDAVARDAHDGEMSPREAEALLDGQRDQEVRPEEIVRQLQGARVAEPREDW